MVQIFQCNPWYGHEFCEVRHSSYFGRNAWASHQHRSVSQQDLGIIPRMVIWGVLGMGINMAMIIFSKGTPIFLEYMGLEYASTLMNGGFLSCQISGCTGYFRYNELYIRSCIHDIT